MEIRQAISMYLTAKAYKDTEFEKKFKNENKNLDECVTYVTYMVYKKVKEKAEENRGMAVAIPSDDEVFAYAEQYYMDEDLKVDGDSLNNVRVISASATSFTDEEKAEMRKQAIKKYQDDVIAETKKKNEEQKKKKEKAKKPTTPVLVPDTPKKEEKTESKAEIKQPSLF